MYTWSHALSDLHRQTRGPSLHATPLRWLLIACVSLIGALGVLVMPATSLGATGDTWTSQTTLVDNYWVSITYGNGLFVAVAENGTGDRVMTSPDGITWASQTSAADNQWISVTYGKGLFVAVANSGTNRVMTSPNGINWTSQASPAGDNTWTSVTYGKGRFVAVASDGTPNQVMTSPNGINWTSQTSAAMNFWSSVTYGNRLFVAVASDGIGNRVMTSPNGINWTSRTSAADNRWKSVTYGNGLFVAVASGGIGNRVMASPNGINWTSQNAAVDNNWNSVTYGNGLFVAVAYNGTNNRVMTSAPVNTFTMKILKISARSITTQLNLPGEGIVVQVGTTPLPKQRATEMAKKARTMIVCRALKAVTKAGKVTIICHLTAKARAARKKHQLTVRLVTTFFTPMSDTALSVSRTLVLEKTR